MRILMIFLTVTSCFSMIGFGLLFLTHPPKDISQLIGYRTRRSSMNIDTWKYAHLLAGKIWLYSGIVLLILSIAYLLILWNSPLFAKFLIPMIIMQNIVLIGVFIPTKIGLKKNFDSYGRPIKITE